MTSTPIEFWFELASTYSYPAAMRIESAATTAGVKILWRPFLLGPLFRAQGYGDSPFIQYPVKGRYMWRDVARLCARYGLPFRMPSSFPRTSVLGARIACAFQDEAWVPQFVRALYHANFAEDLDIGSEAVVARCLIRCAQNPAERFADVQSAPLKDRLRQQTEQATALALFGAPSFRVGDELFWGNDRLEDALAWARGEHPRPA
ncbi:MAG: 2-hydroxychromene-2-carboxylate isomerase [Sinimarinibacterium sp.]|jgi:2-hydroxychromene-2-carboxylate isomerase